MESIPGATLTVEMAGGVDMNSPYYRLQLPYAPAMRWKPINTQGLYLKLSMESPCCGEVVVPSRKAGRSNLICSKCNNASDVRPCYFRLERTKMNLGNWRIDDEAVESLENWLSRYTNPLRAGLHSLVIADLVLETTTLVELECGRTINDPRARLDSRVEQAIMAKTLNLVKEEY